MQRHYAISRLEDIFKIMKLYCTILRMCKTPIKVKHTHTYAHTTATPYTKVSTLPVSLNPTDYYPVYLK